MDSIENGYLVQYLEQNALFAKTVVVKLTEAADLINEGVVANYGGAAVDKNHPETWKYYMNLAGLYHPTDTIMTVVSIDTLETIDFTLDNLRVHTATAKAHAYGTRLYHSLVYRYPQQEGLINGILCPADITTAIEAESGTIVSYRKDLIETNEVTLLADLEVYIKNVMHRWYNVQFAMSDGYYVAAFFTQLHAFIYPKLLGLRMKRAKTSEAHSFHVRMYLASHSGLDRYLPYMTLKQSLWFYRNINYVQRNAGKVSQFNKLMEKLLTDRGIPIGRYTMRQLDSFQLNYRANIKVRRKMLNVGQSILTSDFQPFESLINKEVDICPGNKDYLDIHTDSIRLKAETANSSVIGTKVLDSSMVDYTDAVPEPFEVVALRQWCYMATHGLYEAVVSFKDPKTSETRTLSALDAFIYLQYVSLNADGITIEQMPDYLNMQQRINPKPTVADLLSVVAYKEHDLQLYAEEIVRRQPTIEACFSVTAFNQHVYRIADEAYWHWFLISSIQDYYERGQVENMVRRLYEDTRVHLGVTMSQWLEKNNMPAYNFDRLEAMAAIKAIYEAATGQYVDDTRLLKNIQKAMVDLMTELSSYSIQITREINASDLLIINWPAVRFGNRRQSQSIGRTIDASTVLLSSTGASEQPAKILAGTDSSSLEKQVTNGYQMTAKVETITSVVAGAQLETSYDDVGAFMRMDVTYEGQNETLDQEMKLPGYTTFHNLSEALQKQLKSIY